MDIALGLDVRIMTSQGVRRDQLQQVYIVELQQVYIAVVFFYYK